MPKTKSNLNLLDFNNKYNPKSIAKNLYETWQAKRLFSSDRKQKAYSIVLAPPNLTGYLHLGHALELSLSDLFLRFQRLNGKNVCWIPGYDHAGIATQAKYEKLLNDKERLSYFNSSKSKRFNAVMKWALTQGETICFQIKMMGASVDWDNHHFTLDKNSSYAVNYAFKKLYDKGYIFRAKKLVNWDIKLNTAISNIEVENKPTKQAMYHVLYKIPSKNKSLVVATTRPETIFADTAIFVNPNDMRYKKYIGETAINPLTDEPIKIYADTYVDSSFGTGVMKCTPGHDLNDYKLGKKYKLKEISCINFDGTLNELAKQFKGMDRIVAREAISRYLKENDKLLKIEEITSNVGISSRSGAIIEPLLSTQWFIDLAKMTPELKRLIKNNKNLEVYPSKFLKALNQWLDNSEEWCISRQLIWGHKIPVWYHRKTKKIYVDINPPKNLKDYTRDNDVLDTWFSSSLWPLICFNWPNSKTWKNYYPNDLMIMGSDILFFWGIKMMFQGVFHTKKIPFKKLLLHGLIRDGNGAKMSKSLGNVIDPILLIEQYGVDALRVYLTSNTTPGEDTNFQENKLKDAYNLLNKLWNGSKYIFSLPKNKFTNITNLKKIQLQSADQWILNQLSLTSDKIKKLLNDFQFTLANKYIYEFIWNDFCNTYLELSKYGSNSDQKDLTVFILRYVLKMICIIFHPFAPFLTERIFQKLVNDPKKFILNEKWPGPKELIIFKQNRFEIIVEMLYLIRNFRNEMKLNVSDDLEIIIFLKDKENIELIQKSLNYFQSVKSKVIKITCDLKDTKGQVLVSKSFSIFVLNKNINDSAKKILMKKILDLEFEVNRSNKILNNKAFIAKAPKAKVKLEQEKLKNYESELKLAKQKLKENF